MKSRLIVTLAIVLAIVGIGVAVWTKKDKSAESALPAAGKPAVPSVQTSATAGVAVRPTPGATNAEPINARPPGGPKADAPIPNPSSVFPGTPMVRSGAELPRSTNAVEPAIPPRVLSQPEARADILNVALMFRDFRTKLGGNPVGSNAEIMKAVMGGNSAQATLGPPPGQGLNDKGELVDRWGTPYFFHQLSKTHMEIRSAGPDRIMWNSDDVIGR